MTNDLSPAYMLGAFDRSNVPPDLIDRIEKRLGNAQRKTSGNPKEGEWIAGVRGRCPRFAHEDERSSFAADTVRTDDGRLKLLLNCKGGCTYWQLEIAVFDLLSGLIAAKEDSAASSRPGGADEDDLGPVENYYTYVNQYGTPHLQIRRHANKEFRAWHAGAQGWRPGAAGRHVLYNLRNVTNAPPGGLVFVVEGEKDADTLNSLKLDLVATTKPFGANAKWEPQYTEALEGKLVYIFGDLDQVGVMCRRATYAALVAGGVQAYEVIWSNEPEFDDLPAKHGLDVTDAVRSGALTAEWFQQLIAGTTG